jgi:sulfur relay (sulfurtransferase) DsrC/TusE family protein
MTRMIIKRVKLMIGMEVGDKHFLQQTFNKASAKLFNIRKRTVKYSARHRTFQAMHH